MGSYIKLGISELDDVLPLIPKGYSFLIYGPSGVGKTVLGLQFMCDGIKKFDEKGVYFVLKDFPDDLRFKAISLGFDTSKAERENMLIIVDCLSSSASIKSSEKFTSDNTVSGILRTLKRIIDHIGNVDRIVIDPISIMFEEHRDIREISKLIAVLSRLKITSFLISCEKYARDLEYLCSGIIEMTLESYDREPIYSLIIRKIEGIRQQTPLRFPYRILRGRGIHFLKTEETTQT